MEPILDWGNNSLEADGVGTKVLLVQAPRPAGLRPQVRQLCPAQPGAYGMVDQHGELLYVGKAKNLRRRLLSYFRRRGRDRKSGRILRQTRGIAWEPCESEFAALHRELELIRRWRPRWNVQGQPRRRLFAFLCLGRSPAPYVFLSRKPPARAMACVGPIPFGVRAREAVRRFNDLFQLRDCPQSQEMIFAEQKELFPTDRAPGCLRYELGTCLGPCIAGCTRKSYSEQARAACDFLAGVDRSALVDLETSMRQAAESQNFERAAALRDKLASLQWLADKLDYVRLVRARESFVYPAPGSRGRCTWFLIHGGRTVSAIPAPRDRESAAVAIQAIKAVFDKPPSDHVLELYEHWDGMCLVRSWFRRHPGEREKIITPEKALTECECIWRASRRQRDLRALA